MGGLSWTGTMFNDVWYSTDGTNWTCATANAAWTPRYQPQAVVYDNKMWLLGGQDASPHARFVRAVSGFFELAFLVAVVAWFLWLLRDPRAATAGLVAFVVGAATGGVRRFRR